MVKCNDNQRLKLLLPFAVVALFILSLIIVTFFALWNNFDLKRLYNTLADPYIQHVLYFTLLQATISTVLTIALAIPIARALHRRNKFFGRGFLLKFLNLSFVLPVITLVLGIAVIHGKNGWINNLIHYFYGTSLDYYLYGFPGVLLGHLAFCLPLATRTFLNRFNMIPSEFWQNASQLEFSSINIFRIIEWPSVKVPLITITTLIFMMCFSSFVIVLALGGGPAFTTIEVAIYQALKFDFDLDIAVNLAFIQFIICICLIAIVQRFNTPFFAFVGNNPKQYNRPDINNITAKILDIFAIFILFVISVLPVIAIFVSGYKGKITYVIYNAAFWDAVKTSLTISFYSGILTIIMSLCLVSGAFFFRYHAKKQKFSENIMWISNATLTIPAFIFITGLFIAFHQYISIIDVSYYLIIIINSISALPFAVNILLPTSLNFNIHEIYLCQNLNITGWNFIKLFYWPHMRKTLGYALALSITMSWGDLNIIALFGNNSLNTLPFLMYNMMSSYQIQSASVVALVILLLSFLLFWTIEEFVGGE